MQPNTTTDITQEELINDFIIDAEEYSLAIELNLLKLEKEQKKTPIINDLFRAFHTIKGISASLNLNPIKEVSQKVEIMLSFLRDKKMVTTPEIIDSILCASDSLKIMINALKDKKLNIIDTSLHTDKIDAIMSASNNKKPKHTKLPLKRIKTLMKPAPRFGQFLVNTGTVKEDDVMEALNYQRKLTTPIGEISIKEKMLNIKQVMRILNAQCDTNKLFGEVAIELGYLTETDLDLLLVKQKELRPRIGEILVKMKKISNYVLNKRLSSFFKYLESAKQ